MKHDILQIVRILLADVAEKPERLERAYELAEDQITPIIMAQTDEVPQLCQSHYDGYGCSRLDGHSGDHVAQGMRGGVLMRWTEPKHLDHD